MKFPPEFLDEIKARLPASQVIGARIKLKKQGREWRGLSPFNAEKTPSFYVNDQKQFFHDFSSGNHGNIFDFLMLTEGLNFREAVERLAQEAGLNLPRQDPVREQTRASLHEVLAIAAEIFERNLQASVGASARAYLANRGVQAETQKTFRLGFACNEKFALRDALAQRNVDVQLMIEAGLLVHGEGISTPYDRFQNRVMFPIQDRAGKIIAFGGRALAADAKAKYLNSPETELFHKGHMLFNHHRARKPAHDKGKLIVVEGYVDALSLTQAGFPHVVAPLGTALTPEQCALLWSLCPAPILCFDGDKAGRKAAFRALEIALPLIKPEKTLRFALLPEGQDPDDLARTQGAEGIAAVLTKARSFADMLFLRETEAQVFDTPEARAALEHRISQSVALIQEETLRKHYAQDMTQRLRTLFAVPKRTFPPRFAPQNPRLGIAKQPLPPMRFAPQPQEPSREITLIAALLNHPHLIDNHAEELAELTFSSPRLATFRTQLLSIAPECEPQAQALATALNNAGLANERDRILALARQMPIWNYLCENAAVKDIETVFAQSLALQHNFRTLDRELVSAVLAFQTNPSEGNLAQLLDVKQRIEDFVGKEASLEGFGLTNAQN